MKDFNKSGPYAVSYLGCIKNRFMVGFGIKLAADEL
jgi:hypothetical protein